MFYFNGYQCFVEIKLHSKQYCLFVDITFINNQMTIYNIFVHVRDFIKMTSGVTLNSFRLETTAICD